jgi:endonuclease/exonuclease/phosphatase family metal-dependent hydrolase
MLDNMVRRVVVLLLALVASLLADVGANPAGAPGPGNATEYTVVQMNLCLSGRAGCFARTRYPAVVDEAVRQIRRYDADAVTLAEVCSGDVRTLADELGYAARFAPVDAGSGLPIRCRTPSGRGVYGIAVLSRAPVTHSHDTRYDSQDGIEDRQALCVTTAQEITVCGTHLTLRLPQPVGKVNEAQCRELANLLAHRRRHGPLLASGDMNRTEPCAPPGMWTRTDAAALQSAGLQHVYGNAAFADPVARVEPMRFTDHDALVVTTRLRR